MYWIKFCYLGKQSAITSIIPVFFVTLTFQRKFYLFTYFWMCWVPYTWDELSKCSPKTRQAVVEQLVALLRKDPKSLYPRGPRDHGHLLCQTAAFPGKQTVSRTRGHQV